MPNYQNGKIYRLLTSTSPKCYIGFTTDKLSNRLSKHKAAYKQHKQSNYRYNTSFALITKSNAKAPVRIELLEAYPCDSRAALQEREKYWIGRFKGRCVNRRR